MVSLVVLVRARERHTDSDTRLAGFANDYRLPNWVLPCPQDDTGHTADERESGPLERRSSLRVRLEGAPLVIISPVGTWIATRNLGLKLEPF